MLQCKIMLVNAPKPEKLVNMSGAVLTISSKNYSSWSLRGWLLCRMAGLEFKEELRSHDDPSTRAELLLLSPSFLVPCLTHNGNKIWDTLAIAEYLHENFPKAGLLPADAAARTHCRSISGEMHSGFSNLRSALPMNLKAHYKGFKIWAAAQADIARTLGRVYLGRETSEQVLRGKMSRGITEKIKTVLWFSDLRASTAISERMEPGEIIPFLNDYAQASIDAIHDAGGEVLKLIGDGVLAMFTNENMSIAKRNALRAEHRFRHNMDVLNARRSAEGRPTTTAHVGLHIGEVFYGNIGSDDRLDFTVVGPAVNEVSRIASMCRSVDREFLTSADFRNGLDATGRNYLVSTGRGYFVSTGRFALRGIGHAQDLYTLDPDILTDEIVAGKYARYVAG